MHDAKQDTRSFIIQSYLFGEADCLTDEASLLELGILDSTGVLELVAHLEQHYGFKVKAEEMVPENLDSINAIADFVHRKLQACVPPASHGDPHRA